MKNFFLILTLLFSTAINAQNLSVTPLIFQSPEQSYVEVHLFVLGSSVEFAPTSADSIQKQAAVEVLMLLKQDTNIINFEKYILNSPQTILPVNFVDLKRFAVANGDYDLEVQVKDVNQSIPPVIVNQKVSVNFPTDSLNISDIQLIASMRQDTTGGVLTKGGYFLETLPYQFYTKASEKLIFYAEAYDTDQHIGEDFALHYRVELIYTNGRKRTMLQRTIRRKPTGILPILMQTDIKELPSGNYRLVVEIQNKEKAVLSSKSVLFQRSNPNVSQVIIRDPVKLEGKFVEKIDSVDVYYALKAMVPILDNNQTPFVNELIRSGSYSQQKQYLFAYWAQQNEQNPKAVYEAYMKVARAVDTKFHSGLGAGFESDRGYIFLKYGRPDDITTVEDEPSAPPYEIWSYNQFSATNQQNVRFLFYNPTLAIGQFQLLHSTARGELFNPQWEVELYRDDVSGTIQGTNMDSRTAPDNVGRRARRYFNDF